MNDEYQINTEPNGFKNLSTDEPVHKIDLKLTEDQFIKLGFFSHFKEDFVFLNDWVELRNFSSYPKKVILFRQIFLLICVFQSAGGIVLASHCHDFNGNWVHLSAYLFSSIMAIIGLYIVALMRVFIMKPFYLFSSIFLSCLFTFQLIDTLYRQNRSITSRLTDRKYEFLYSLFHLIGLFNSYLCKLLHSETTTAVNLEIVSSKAKTKKDILSLKTTYTRRFLLEHIEGVDRIMCVLCCHNKRNIILLPCTHLLVCEKCIKNCYELEIKSLAEPSCPQCLKKVDCYYKLKPRQEQSFLSDCTLNTSKKESLQMVEVLNSR